MKIQVVFGKKATRNFFISIGRGGFVFCFSVSELEKRGKKAISNPILGWRSTRYPRS